MKKVKMTKKEQEKFLKDPFGWVTRHIGQEIQLEVPEKETYYYIIKTDAKPLEIMDCEHVIGNKRYSGQAVQLSENELKSLKNRLKYDSEKNSRTGKNIRSVEEKLCEILRG